MLIFFHNVEFYVVRSCVENYSSYNRIKIIKTLKVILRVGQIWNIPLLRLKGRRYFSRYSCKNVTFVLFRSTENWKQFPIDNLSLKTAIYINVLHDCGKKIRFFVHHICENISEEMNNYNNWNFYSRAKRSNWLRHWVRFLKEHDITEYIFPTFFSSR